MSRIFLTSTMRRSFILDDVSLLQRNYDVDFFIGSGVVDAVRMFVRALRADVSICWFASVYSFVVTLSAKLFGKKSIIIVGGADAAAIPELDYGIWLSTWKSWFLRKALRWADGIFVVDDRLRESLEHHSRLSLEKAALLPTGYDIEFWRLPESDTVRDGILCVASCDSVQRAQVKGIDVFLQVADDLPDLRFTLIGVEQSFQKRMPFTVSPNVKLLPSIDRDQLREYYQRAEIYCQPSRHEGLSNVLCEAMLCGAIPVATDVGGTATAVGEFGVVVAPEDFDALRNGILASLSLPEETRENAHQHIAQRFPKELREQRLMTLMNQMIGKNGA